MLTNVIMGGVILSELMMAWWAIKKPLKGLLLLLAVRLLVPDICRAIVIDLSLNTVLTIILAMGTFLGIMNNRIKNGEFRQPLFKFIIWYMVLTFLVILIPNTVPFQVQLTSYIQFFICQLLPALLMMILIQNQEDLKKVLKVLAVSIAICMGYGVVCMLLQIPFEYNSLFLQMFGNEHELTMVENSFEQEMGGIAGRIIGTCVGRSYAFGMIAPVVFAMVWCIRTKTGNKRLNWLVLLCGIAVLFTVRRSPIIAAMTFVMIILIYNKVIFKLKYILSFASLLIIVYLVITYSPSFSNYKNILEASLYFWDENVSTHNNISGSSVSFRLYQLEYTLRQIADSPLFGCGYGSCFYKNRHPSMVGWESIVFTTLMQAGIYGAITTVMLYFKMYKYSVQNAKRKIYEVAFILSAVTLCLFTDTIYPFFIFCGCIIMNKINRFGTSQVQRQIA